MYKKSKREILLFEVTVFISLFVNCGYAFQVGSITITYSLLCQIMFVLLYLSSEHKYYLTKRRLGASLILVLTIAVSFYVLKTNENLPNIIPWTTRMDDVYFQTAGGVPPSFGYGNMLNIIYILWFAIFTGCAGGIMRKKEAIDHFIRSFYKVSKILFIIAGIEFLINNIFSPTFLRHIVQIITGISSNGYSAPQMRNGFYGILLAFNESSYFVVFISLYVFIFITGINYNFNLKWIIYSFIIMFLSGGTSAILCILVGMIAILKDSFIKSTKSKFLNRIIFLGMISLIGIFILLIASDYAYSVLQNMFDKLTSYFSDTYISSAVSGTIRQMGNSYAYRAFFNSPIWGIGFGTTRAYGILPGTLANSGIIGTLSLLYWLKTRTYCKIEKSNIVPFIILLVASSSILTVTYLYNPAIIAFALPFNAELKHLESQNTKVITKGFCHENII